MATDIYQQAGSGFDDDLFGDDEITGDLGDVSMEMDASFPTETTEAGLSSQAAESSFPADSMDTDLMAELTREGLMGAEEGGQDGGLPDFNDMDNFHVGGDASKADDAQDFGDISDDDDLPDEEGLPQNATTTLDQLLPAAPSGDLDTEDFDDLFGGPSSPVEHFPSQTVSTQMTHPDEAGDHDSDIASEHDEDVNDTKDVDPDMTEEEFQQWRLQQALLSGAGQMPQTAKENLIEAAKLEFPAFREDEVPFWTRLLPPKPGNFVPKQPARLPKSIRPSKLNLELESDQRTLFSSGAPLPSTAEFAPGLVKASLATPQNGEEDISDDSDAEDALPGEYSMQDLELICQDFDTLSQAADSDSGVGDLSPTSTPEDDDLFTELGDSAQPIKKRRLGLDAHEIVTIHRFDMPSFDEPERDTAKLSSNIILDLNDPNLLVEQVDPDTVRIRARPGEKVVSIKTTKDRLKSRFKTSNDAEYDLLKQNRQQKVRGQLGHMSIDHSVPALRLQYPYYRLKLPLAELRNYHRKRMVFRHPIVFNKLRKSKRKERKGKSIKDVFATTKDLSSGDNSSALLLEYSEEHPIMLSQAGMGNKIVNYYRKKTPDDSNRPKADIGETNVLLPEDKSPFNLFGHIDPGETVTTLYNSMYRAPIFEHPAKPQDFLVLRETTGLGGTQHYLRSIDHVYAVGQELPFVTVPGTHSRMVTTTSKNRLKAISFRIARRKKSQRIRVEEVTRHIPDSTDMQNRQKMKEFMAFNKEHKEWEMRAGEALPDEDAIQVLIKPEDICLLESMQVGHQYLQDAGYADNDDDDDKDDNDNDAIEQQLAPWKTTKNFLQATQGKAMLKLFGEGDPSGRGEAFSFIKTSMKGGFKAVGGSVEDAIQMKKELGGHSYNVAKQQKSYEDSIRAIWDKQKASLSSHIEPSDMDDEGVDGQVDNEENRKQESRGTRSVTPAPARRRDDETMTSFSKRSINSSAQRYLTITRTVMVDGEEKEVSEIITDPAVIKQYQRLKEAEEARQIKIADIVPTGDADFDSRQVKRIQEELARLEKAKARRAQRDKTKAALNAASPGAASPDGDAPNVGPTGRPVQATQRKCANCGQVGHIKTNKKLCPLLNGSAKQEDPFSNAAFMGAPPTQF